MIASDRYLERVIDLIGQVRDTQAEAIASVSKRVAESLSKGGVLHVFGSGHGIIFGKEAFNRSGGLGPVNPIYDATLLGPFGGARKTALLQDVEDYAPVVFEGYDVRPGEVMLQFSASGAHSLVCEVCVEAKRRGLYVVAITNVSYSRSSAAKHSSGKRLFELADEVIDNPGPVGDAAVTVDGVDSPVGATSTITGICILNSIVVQTIERMAKAGSPPPIVSSHATPNSSARNREMFDRYQIRLKHL